MLRPIPHWPKVRLVVARLLLVPPPGGEVERRPKEKLTVYLKDGKSYAAEVSHPSRISGGEKIEAKFFTCVNGSLSQDAAKQLRDWLLELEKLSDVGKIMDVSRCG